MARVQKKAGMKMLASTHFSEAAALSTSAVLLSTALVLANTSNMSAPALVTKRVRGVGFGAMLVLRHELIHLAMLPLESAMRDCNDARVYTQ